MKHMSKKSIVLLSAISIILVIAVVMGALFASGIFSSKDDPDASDDVSQATDKENEKENENTDKYFKIDFKHPDSMSADDKAATALPESVTLEKGSLLYTVPYPEREGYIFGGWYYDGALTDLVSAEDTLLQNTVLYPLMIESMGNDTSVEQRPMFTSALNVDTDYAVTVKAKDEQTISNALFINAVSEGNVQKSAAIAPNGDGTFTVTPEGGFVAGGTYQFKALDRFDDTVAEEDYILFVENGEVLSANVKYFNVTVSGEEFDNLRMDSDLKYLPVGETEGFSFDGTGMITLSVGSDGVSALPNEAVGNFTYEGKMLFAGDVVAIYSGTLNTDGTVKDGEEISYVKITDVSENVYTYKIASPDEVIFLPDILPIVSDADLDPTDSIIKVAYSALDYSDFDCKGEMSLDSEAVAEKDDYIAVYMGDFTIESIIAYYKINEVNREGGYTQMTVEKTSLEEIEGSLGAYQQRGIDLSLSENEIKELKNMIATQAIESEFDTETATFITQMLIASGEEPGPMSAQNLQIVVLDEEGRDIPMENVTPLVEVEAGVTALVIRLGHVDLEVELTNQLKQISSIHGGKGLRALLHVQVPLTIETVLNGKEVLDSLHLKLTATFEQELTVDVNFWWDIDGVFKNIDIGADFDVGTYTGVGATFSVSTAADYDANFDWDKFIKAFDSEYEPAKAKIESIAKTLNALMDDPYEFFDSESGNSLITQYKEMLENDLEYVEVLAVMLYKHQMHLDKLHIIHVQFMFEFTVSVKANISVGMSFEHKMVKRFSFAIDVDDQDATHNVTTLEDGYTNFNFFAMGNLGVRMGVRATFKIGLINVKWDNVGLMVEMGPYVDLYGFFFFHYEITEDAETGKIEDELRFAGAYYIEIGIYMDVDFFGGVMHDMVGFTIHLAEPEWPIWKSGDGIFPCAPAFPESELRIVQNSKPLREIKLGGPAAYKTLGIQMVDVRTGNTFTREYKAKDFEFIIDNPAFKFDPDTMILSVDVPDDTTFRIDGEMRVVFKRAGLPLTNEPIVSVVKLLWEKRWPDVIVYFQDYVYNDGWRTTKTLYPKGSDVNGWQTFLEGTSAVGINYPDYTAPAGYDFKGWVYSGTEEFFDPNRTLTDIVALLPLNEPRTDTPYTVRHYVQSLNNPESYDLYLEEKKTGTTGTLIDTDHVMEIEGASLNKGRLPIHTQHIFGDATVNVYGVTINGDGSTVVEYYYTRDSYQIVLEATNTSLRWYNELGYYTQRGSYVSGSIIDTSAFIGEIPGYSFVGWVDADTVDGVDDAKNGEILAELPTVEKRAHYYAVYLPDENVKYTVRHHVFDYFGTESTMIGEDTHFGVAESVIALEDIVADINYKSVLSYRNGLSYTDMKVSPYGNLVIDLYYYVPYYRVNWNGYAEDTYEMMYEGQIITPPETSPTKDGYVFSHWEGYAEGMKMGDAEISFNPVFAGDTVKYTVIHARQDLENRYDNELWIETEILEGIAGEEITPALRSYEGFDSPDAQAVTVAGDGSLVVIYKYQRSAYKLTLKSEGSSDEESSYRYGLLRDLPASLTRDGYSFVGWYLEGDDSKTPVDSVDSYALKDLTYIALWEKIGISYTVNYYLEALDGNFDVNSVELTGNIDERYTAEIKDYPGFSFDNGAENNILSGIITSENDTLVLKLYYTRNTYTVTWKNYDGSELGTTAFKFGESITYPTSLASPTRVGYILDAWADLGSMGARDIIISAKDKAEWKANIYTVIFDANGGEGEMSPQSFTYGIAQALRSNEFKYQYRNFVGWSNMTNGEVLYTDSQQIIDLTATDGETVRLYAVWEMAEGAQTTYTVEHYTESLDGSSYEKHHTSTLYGEIGAAVSGSAISIEGFSFDASNVKNILSATVAEDGGTVLKLYYSRELYDLVIDFGGEQIKVALTERDEYGIPTYGEKQIADETVSVPFGANIADYLPVDSLNEIGYVFSGWSNSEGTMPAKTVTVTAQWTPVKVSVTFYPGTYYMFPDGYDFEANKVVKTYDYGTLIELPADVSFINETYVIAGWIFGASQGNYPTLDHFPLILLEGYYLEDMPVLRTQAQDENGDPAYDENGDPIYTDEYAITVSPYWTNKNYADVVTFNGNGGGGSMEDMYIDSYAFRALPNCDFVYDGYRFVGWNTEADGSGIAYSVAEDFYGDSGYSSQKTTLYAQWEKIS